MNPALAQLRPYPFERLRALLAGAQAAGGSDAHFAVDRRAAACAAAVRAGRADRESRGLWQLSDDCGRAAAASSRGRVADATFPLPQGSVDPETMVLPVNGTREAIVRVRAGDGRCRASAAGRDAESVLSDLRRRRVARRRRAVLHRQRSRATPTCPISTSVPPEVWQRCQLLFLCSPGNPTGAVASIDYLRRALAARRSLRLRRRLRRVLQRNLSRRSASAAGPAAGGGCERPRRLRALRRLPQPVEALERAGTALRLRRGRCAADQVVPAVPHVSRLRAAAATRSSRAFAAWNDDAHVVENRALVSREVRGGAADPARSAGSRCAGGELLPVAESRRRRTLRARSCSSAST